MPSQTQALQVRSKAPSPRPSPAKRPCWNHAICDVRQCDGFSGSIWKMTCWPVARHIATQVGVARALPSCEISRIDCKRPERRGTPEACCQSGTLAGDDTPPLSVPNHPSGSQQQSTGNAHQKRIGRTGKQQICQGVMAERKGFEPSRRFPAYTLSRRAPSTTRPPLRRRL